MLPTSFRFAISGAEKGAALNVYRAVTGAGIADAKHAVDEAVRQAGR